MSLLNLQGKSLHRYAHRVARFHGKKDAELGVSKTELSVIVQASMMGISKSAKALQVLQAEHAQLPVEDIAARTLELFCSHDISLAAVLCSGYENDRYSDLLLSQHDAKKLAERVRVLNGQKEKIAHTQIEKLGGGYRDIWSFGRVRYAQQVALAWIIEALAPTNPYDFSLPGRGGIHGAAKAIGLALEQGHRFVVTADGKNAFPSVKKEHLALVCSLHEQLTDYVCFPVLPFNPDALVVLSPNVSISLSLLDESNTEAKAAPCQLPQGAAHSSLVLSALTGGCLSQLKGNIVIIVYADNIAICAHTREEAQNAMETLRKALGSLSAGPLLLHDIQLRDGWLHDGKFLEAGKPPVYGAVEFCGYRISRDQYDGDIRYRPSRKSFAAFRRKLRHEIFKPWMTDDEMFEAGMKSGQAWRRGFPLWNDTGEYVEFNVVTEMQDTKDWWAYLAWQKKSA